MLIFAVLITWARAAGRTLINEYTPRTGRHRGAGRATRADWRRAAARTDRHGDSYNPAHRGSLYGVTYVLQQTTRGLTAHSWASVPTAAYPTVVSNP